MGGILDFIDKQARDLGDALAGRDNSQKRTAQNNVSARAQAQANAKRAKELFEQIKNDETISDVTRKELLFAFSELDPNQFIFKPQEDVRGRKQVTDGRKGEGYSSTTNFSDIAGQDFNPNLNTADYHIKESLLTQNRPKSLDEIQQILETATAGEDNKFASRQRRQAKSNLLKDKPGAKQFLIDPPQKQSLTNNQSLSNSPLVPTLPSLLGR